MDASFHPAIEADDDGRDFFTRHGAEQLKLRIEAYWRERGAEVQVSLAPGGFTPALRAARMDVRSDMINGMPRQRRASP